MDDDNIFLYYCRKHENMFINMNNLPILQQLSEIRLKVLLLPMHTEYTV